MDEFNREQRPKRPRRKKRSQVQIFKETYLPLVIAGIALLMILIFIIGSIARGIQRNRYEAKLNQEASIANAELMAQQTKEAENLLEEATKLAQHYDYGGAITLIDNFSGKLSDFPKLSKLHTECTQAQTTLVKWSDFNDVVNLSVQMLIADPNRAFQDAKYGNSYKKNFITTHEFTEIIQQLYENNYILIRLSDMVVDGQVQELYLPSGKKPLILTQTQVNYNTYMIDGDGDKLPDKDGDGFASKLIVDENGNLTCEMVDAAGQTQTGSFDLVPILNAFVDAHPDFSYKGAKAILAVTGYDGLFGYRTNASAENTFGTDTYQAELDGASKIVNALRDSGYEFACYTYENAAYGQYESAKIQYDMTQWNNEVVPILGEIDTLVFARNSDISDNTAPYSGEKFETLQSFGFSKYLGFCNEGFGWFLSDTNYIRQGRIMLTGERLKQNADWFEEMFDTASILDPSRPG